ncbi:hypothetical protein [Sphingomonas sp. Leaf21]|uniref:hypothetical protein n=1 Tax=Sphingomonas sp. Leaf21 TaxID=2876550 RepID=UPI001E2C6954|nr:hypothetical protein [Sphingomonas sp. Leaf21]
MKPITKFQAACIGGLTGAAVLFLGALILARPKVWAGFAGISGGDWLQAMATILGIALTVRATMWLEDRKRNQDLQQEKRLLREALGQMQNIVGVIGVELDPSEPLFTRRMAVAGQYEVLRTSWDSVQDARQNFRANSFALWVALNDLSETFNRDRAMLRGEEGIVSGRVTEEVLRISHRRLKAVAETIEPHIRLALEAL